MESSLIAGKDVTGEVTMNDVASADEFDSFLDELGALSRFQLLLIATGTLLMFSGFTVTTLPVFLSATPDFRLVIWAGTGSLHSYRMQMTTNPAF